MHSPLHLYNLLSERSLQHLPCNPNQTADPPLCAHQQHNHCQGIGELLQPSFLKLSTRCPEIWLAPRSHHFHFLLHLPPQ